MIGVPEWVNEAEATAWGLTPRQLDVLIGAARGMTNNAIGRFYGLSEFTVREYLNIVYRRLDAPCRVAAVVAAFDRGIFVPKRGMEVAA